MKQAGFEEQEFLGTTGFNSSPVTVGALFQAKKTLGEASASFPKMKYVESQAVQKGESAPESDASST